MVYKVDENPPFDSRDLSMYSNILKLPIFLAQKLTEFVTTVAVKVAQPQLCYSNLSKRAIEKKSNVCKEISEVAQKS